MKKLLFIANYNANIDKQKYEGVFKKIKLQIDILKKYFTVDYIYILNNNIYIYKSESKQSILLTEEESKFYKSWSNMYISLSCINEKYDYIYIRNDCVIPELFKFLKKYKGNNGKCKIILEIPTYMKKVEPGTSIISTFAFYYKNILSKKYFKKYIDIIATFSDDKEIYGVPTVNIENAVNVDEFSVIKNDRKNKNIINMLGVAMMTPSHGYDRVIMGIKNYYEKYNYSPDVKVYFYIVGDGIVKKDWEKLVNDNNLNEYIKFLGKKSGADLENIYNKCDIGVASLAIFRKKCSKCSELKIREYCAKGLPFIYSACEPTIENKNFALKVPHNETSINIDNVVKFVNNFDYENIPEQMHKYSKENFVWDKQFEKIFERLI